MRFLTATLPWHLQYDLFVGTLPNITRVKVMMAGASISTTELGNVCLYRSTDAGILLIWFEKEPGGWWWPVWELRAIDLWEGSFLCPERASFSGTGTWTVLGATQQVRLTLI